MSEKKQRKPARGLVGHFTRETCNEGVRLYLRDPVDGKETEDWVLVRGEDSDAVRAAIVEGKRKFFEARDLETQNKEKKDPEVQKRIEELDIQGRDVVRLAAVAGWSDESIPFTPENVLRIWEDGPALGAEIDAVATNRNRFLRLKSISSSNSQSESSD